jgi:hypothetical protein
MAVNNSAFVAYNGFSNIFLKEHIENTRLFLVFREYKNRLWTRFVL